MRILVARWRPITVPEPTGVGLTETMIFDERGPIDRAAQSLLVAER